MILSKQHCKISRGNESSITKSGATAFTVRPVSGVGRGYYGNIVQLQKHAYIRF